MCRFYAALEHVATERLCKTVNHGGALEKRQKLMKIVDIAIINTRVSKPCCTFRISPGNKQAQTLPRSFKCSRFLRRDGNPKHRREKGKGKGCSALQAHGTHGKGCCKQIPTELPRNA